MDMLIANRNHLLRKKEQLLKQVRLYRKDEKVVCMKIDALNQVLNILQDDLHKDREEDTEDEEEEEEDEEVEEIDNNDEYDEEE